jgi:DNA-directed RNA polymerase subunit alpha
LGNSLRRVLLSSIEGSGVTSVKFLSVQHEFSTIPGVLEDVTEIILNIKSLVLSSHSKIPKTIYIKKNTKGQIKAKDIETDETIEIINPDLHIATLTKDTKFNVEMEVARGRGYVPAELNKKEDQTAGVIPIDSIFSPVKKVNFYVENTRVGQRTDYDKLILEITTNGAISPKDALLYASNILQRHLDIFVNFGQLPEEIEEEEPGMSKEEIALYEKLRLPISELELSVRSSNCLRESNIKTIADLVKKTEDEMLSFKNFGKKSLNEIKELLAGMGLTLGMQVDAKKLKKA